MKNKLFVVLAVLVLIRTQQGQINSVGRVDIGQLEIDKEEKDLRQDFQRQLHPWVFEQLQSSNQNNYFQATQSFLLQLSPSQQHEFRHSTTKKRNLFIKLRVFTQESGDDIVIIKNPEQDSRLQVNFKNSLGKQYEFLTNIYLFKVVKFILTNGEVFIQIKNTHSIPIIVQVQIQGDPTRIDLEVIAKNDHFKIMAAKLETLFLQMKQTQSNRKRLYKWQWGFLQRQEHYEQEMLKLTAAQSFIILITSIVQMYCIKSLFDNIQVI